MVKITLPHDKNFYRTWYKALNCKIIYDTENNVNLLDVPNNKPKLEGKASSILSIKNEDALSDLDEDDLKTDSGLIKNSEEYNDKVENKPKKWQIKFPDEEEEEGEEGELVEEETVPIKKSAKEPVRAKVYGKAAYPMRAKEKKTIAKKESLDNMIIEFANLEILFWSDVADDVQIINFKNHIIDYSSNDSFQISYQTGLDENYSRQKRDTCTAHQPVQINNLYVETKKIIEIPLNVTHSMIKHYGEDDYATELYNDKKDFKYDLEQIDEKKQFDKDIYKYNNKIIELKKLISDIEKEHSDKKSNIDFLYEECSICRTEFYKLADKIVTLCCGHVFCKDCITNKSCSSKCPVCRKKFIKESVEHNKVFYDLIKNESCVVKYIKMKGLKESLITNEEKLKYITDIMSFKKYKSVDELIINIANKYNVDLSKLGSSEPLKLNNSVTIKIKSQNKNRNRNRNRNKNLLVPISNQVQS
jgi:hypothetical protein